MLEKVISGGQTGADQAGLRAAKDYGLETGGTAPPGWMTHDGPQKKLLKSYGLVEGEDDPKVFRKRTIKNVEDADGTVWFGRPNSPGGILTLNTAKNLRKHLICNPRHSKGLATWLYKNRIKVLNVAGNREHTNPGIGQKTYFLLVSAFTLYELYFKEEIK